MSRGKTPRHPGSEELLATLSIVPLMAETAALPSTYAASMIQAYCLELAKALLGTSLPPLITTKIPLIAQNHEIDLVLTPLEVETPHLALTSTPSIEQPNYSLIQAHGLSSAGLPSDVYILNQLAGLSESTLGKFSKVALIAQTHIFDLVLAPSTRGRHGLGCKYLTPAQLGVPAGVPN